MLENCESIRILLTLDMSHLVIWSFCRFVNLCRSVCVYLEENISWEFVYRVVSHSVCVLYAAFSCDLMRFNVDKYC